MIPTKRMIWVACLSLPIIILGRGAPPAIGLAWGFLGLTFAGFVLDGILGDRRPRLHLERHAPAQLHVDQTDIIHWIVENHSRFEVRLQLCDQVPVGARAEPRIISLSAPGQSRTTVSYQLSPQHRGPAFFGEMTYRILGPFGLCWRQKRLPARLEIQCLPHLANWKAAELAERRALMRQMGSHRYRWRGAGTVFESLREYSTQDDIRWVDWKATARFGQPMSRNFEVDRHQQVILLVDASRAMTTYCGRRTKFDTVLEAAVLVARAAVDHGDSLGLVLFADQIDAYLPPRRERSQMTAVMEHLYGKYPRLVEPNFELALTRTAQRNHRRSLIILFTDVTVIEAARRMLAYLRILTPRHLPLVVTIADETLEKWEMVEPRTTEDFYRVGVANELVLERTLVLEELRRSGAETLDSPADLVAARTVERYLDLKRRLRL
jgi:uncharacterized protein (DUF58 family)